MLSKVISKQPSQSTITLFSKASKTNGYRKRRSNIRPIQIRVLASKLLSFSSKQHSFLQSDCTHLANRLDTIFDKYNGDRSFKNNYTQNEKSDIEQAIKLTDMLDINAIFNCVTDDSSYNFQDIDTQINKCYIMERPLLICESLLSNTHDPVKHIYIKRYMADLLTNQINKPFSDVVMSAINKGESLAKIAINVAYLIKNQ
ncbi:hypothetical protein DID75_02565 [Candidatus Marinamargulisbacteria bacterium SCGC AG-410-N11]|nr:hypothetical protein DID75_02565 [Candidatus Marinamargulisbacteria bacterium SCGC AG-410-N11]